jgi:hypothetical protein
VVRTPAAPPCDAFRDRRGNGARRAGLLARGGVGAGPDGRRPRKAGRAQGKSERLASRLSLSAVNLCFMILSGAARGRPSTPVEEAGLRRDLANHDDLRPCSAALASYGGGRRGITRIFSRGHPPARLRSGIGWEPESISRHGQAIRSRFSRSLAVRGGQSRCLRWEEPEGAPRPHVQTIHFFSV